MTLESKGRGPLAMFLHSRSARRIATAVEAVERLPPDLGRPQRRRVHVVRGPEGLVADAAHLTLAAVPAFLGSGPNVTLELGPYQSSYSGALSRSPTNPNAVHIGKGGAYAMTYHVHYQGKLGNEFFATIADHGGQLAPLNDSSALASGANPLDGSANVILTVSQSLILRLQIGQELSVVLVRTAGTDPIHIRIPSIFIVHRIGDFVSAS